MTAFTTFYYYYYHLRFYYRLLLLLQIDANHRNNSNSKHNNNKQPNINILINGTQVGLLTITPASASTFPTTARPVTGSPAQEHRFQMVLDWIWYSKTPPETGSLGRTRSESVLGRPVRSGPWIDFPLMNNKQNNKKHSVSVNRDASVPVLPEERFLVGT